MRAALANQSAHHEFAGRLREAFPGIIITHIDVRFAEQVLSTLSDFIFFYFLRQGLAV